MTIKTQGGKVITKDGKVSCECCVSCGCRSIKITDPVLRNTLRNATTGTCYGFAPDTWTSTANGWQVNFFGCFSPDDCFDTTATFDFASNCFTFLLNIGNLVWAGTYEDKSDQCGCQGNCENTVFTINGIEFPAYHQSDDPFDPLDNPKNTPPVFTFS